MDTVKLLTALHRIDHSPFYPRDILTLYTVITHPGCNGLEICRKLGFPYRSAVQGSIPKLINAGYIEDRRVDRRKTVAVSLYVTDAGREFWKSIRDAGEQENANT